MQVLKNIWKFLKKQLKVTKLHIIATDLDRTLLPNGKQEYDGSMPLFKYILNEKNLKLIFVTGRDINLVSDAIKEFDTPIPDFVISDVGTKIYQNIDGEFVEDIGWIDHIDNMTKDWNIKKFKEILVKFSSLRIQEDSKQNDFKLSYYVDDPKSDKHIDEEVRIAINDLCKCATVIFSIDELTNVGLIDILPKNATKLTGIEYLRKRFGCGKDEIIYCGDSGNDILPLTFGYNSIVVRNAMEEVREDIEENLKNNHVHEKLYIAKGYKKLNGYYVSGIIEGLINFGIVKEDILSKD